MSGTSADDSIGAGLALSIAMAIPSKIQSPSFRNLGVRPVGLDAPTGAKADKPAAEKPAPAARGPDLDREMAGPPEPADVKSVAEAAKSPSGVVEAGHADALPQAPARRRGLAPSPEAAGGPKSLGSIAKELESGLGAIAGDPGSSPNESGGPKSLGSIAKELESGLRRIVDGQDPTGTQPGESGDAKNALGSIADQIKSELGRIAKGKGPSAGRPGDESGRDEKTLRSISDQLKSGLRAIAEGKGSLGAQPSQSGENDKTLRDVAEQFKPGLGGIAGGKGPSDDDKTLRDVAEQFKPGLGGILGA